MSEENIIDLDDHRASAEATAKDLVPVLSEDAIALEFVRRHKDLVRFDSTAKRWHVWRDGRWRRDDTSVAFSWARNLARALARDQNAGDRRRLGTKKFSEGVEGLAQTDQRIVVTSERWDQAVDMIGTPNGYVDLRTGEFFDPDPEQFITRATSVDPDMMTGCPRFLQFVDQATGGDEQMKRLLQQYAGYCLTGETKEQKFLFVHGPTNTGKSTLANIMLQIMAEYAATAGMEMFDAAKFDQHPEQIARLKNKRLVVASETEAGGRWREKRIKQMVGGDVITTRLMNQGSFEFRPRFKLLLLGNNAPTISSTDGAMQRRLLVVPFVHRPAEVDLDLEKIILAKEQPGILRWMIDGAIDWYTHGLIMPKAVSEATTQYFDEQNIFQQWLDECCDVELENERLMERTTDLFTSWSIFSKAHGEMPGTQAALNSKLRSAGFDPKQIKGLGTKGCHGIRLKVTSSHWQGGTE
jgi:putative DNA primase/helicase